MLQEVLCAYRYRGVRDRKRKWCMVRVGRNQRKVDGASEAPEARARAKACMQSGRESCIHEKLLGVEDGTLPS